MSKGIFYRKNVVKWKLMKQSVSARIVASLAIWCILLCIHLTFTLAHLLPAESKRVMDAVFGFFFAGAVLGTVLCPLFLPVPGGKNKPPAMSIGFIAVLIAVEFITRSLGVHLWLNSVTVRSIMAVPEGILTTMCYGLFYLTWLREPTAKGQENRTGRFCSLVLGAALLCSVLVRYYSAPLLEAGIVAEDPAAQGPFKGVALVFNAIKWCMAAMGVFAAASVLMTHNKSASTEGAVKTDWPTILRFIGLASVFTILNGVLDMRMYPLYSEKAAYYPHYIAVAAAVPVLGLLAGRSIDRFIRWFLPPSIVLFILISCLPLFEEHPQFNMIMSTLFAIVHYTIWVVFTTAVVEHYSVNRSRSFWFYGMATAIFFSGIFAFTAPVISPLVPNSTEYRVLFIVIAAVSFMLLAFRLIFPKQRQKPSSTASAFDVIFRERGLSQREIEVARLLVKEGFGTKEIGKRLYIAAGTAKLHISKIYQKFGVNNRAEFMALFVK